MFNKRAGSLVTKHRIVESSHGLPVLRFNRREVLIEWLARWLVPA